MATKNGNGNGNVFGGGGEYAATVVAAKIATEGARLEQKTARRNEVRTDMLLQRTPLVSALIGQMLLAVIYLIVFGVLSTAAVFLLDWGLQAYLTWWWRPVLAAAFVLGAAFVLHLRNESRAQNERIKPPKAWCLIAGLCFIVGGALLIVVRGELAAAAVDVSGLDPQQLFDKALQSEGRVHALCIAAFMFLVGGLDIGSALAGSLGWYTVTSIRPHLALQRELRELEEEIFLLNDNLIHLRVVRDSMMMPLSTNGNGTENGIHTSSPPSTRVAERNKINRKNGQRFTREGKARTSEVRK